MKSMRCAAWLGLVCGMLMVPSSRAGEWQPISVALKDGTVIEVPLAEAGKTATLRGNPKAARLSERESRQARRLAEKSEKGLTMRVSRVTGVKKSAYERIVITITNTTTDGIEIDKIQFFDQWVPEGDDTGYLSGNTDGSVAVFPKARQYVGVETPLAKVAVKQGKASAWLERGFAIQPKETWRFSYVIGKYAEGQLRRDFQAYLNRERAHPYRVLPHYNSWYDLNINRNDAPWEKRMNEAECLDAMRAFREELGKRGVFIDSYLWDDGWDNWDSLWDFHKGFPNGFQALADEAHKNKGASIGVWMSPCGGYGGSHGARVRYAKSKGIIGPNDGLLRMSKPVYYAAFRDRCIDMIKKYDMNLFKFDRMGSGSDCNGAGKQHAPDMEAIVRLIGEMRAAKQDVFINCTVGTWASPFWVMFADSIWRGGNDWEGLGPGPQRQRWLTYRDNKIYDRFVSKAPLFPLNSIMMHGIIVGRRGPPGCMDVSDSPESTKAFADEVWMGVACGTDLQEYYITPKLMHPAWWDILATGVKWLKANEATLCDTHWIGGDPAVSKTEYNVYGYASLGAKKGIIVLRNPSDAPQTFSATLAAILEMPRAQAAARVKGIKPVYVSGATAGKAPRSAADELSVSFEPFGVYLIEVAF